MLKFYHGTELETLADRLIDELETNPPSNPLKPEIMVAQNHCIWQWVTLYIAEKTGVSANLQFELPSERLWKLIRLLDPDIPDTLPSDRRPMIWSLMALLEDEDFLNNFDNLRHYIREDDPDRQSVRQWKLASKIADVFDQYLIYRPEMILDWQEGRSIPDTEEWQAGLWNQLMKHWKENSDDRWIHRARLQKELWIALDEGSLDPDQLPNRLTVFGISSASPAFVKTMVKLSRLIDIHFYHLTPDPHVTDSHDFANPLLASLGQEAADFMAQFHQSGEEEYIDRQWISSDPSASIKDSAFKKLQHDLRGDKVPDQKWTSDQTIRVHSCHSPMREVEVLYDQLLATLDENPELNPDDILIMTPDIETYAPMIEAVFEMPDKGQPEIPYNIADRGIWETQTAVQTFLKILELCESRFKVTDVLDLLDANPIQEAFDFNDEDMNRLEAWIEDNRIRWGIDGSFKQNVELPQSEHFTWRSGLNRMLLGYAMKQEDHLLHRGIFPYHEVETSDDAKLTGKFSRFLHLLFDMSREVQTNSKPARWSKYLNQIIDDILPKGKKYFQQVLRIRDAVEQLKEAALLGRYHRTVPFRIVRLWLQNQLEEQHTGGGRIGRGVTFSSLVPMRSIPFKMIGMIGMNEGAFPRSKIPAEFDLMHHEPQLGDPERSKEDRHLFWENLLSARTHFYASYVGQSNREDTEFPPSVVLQEFLDFLDQQYDLPSDDTVTEHRLQAFSPHYFEDKEHFSYSRIQLSISQTLSESTSSHESFFTKHLPEPDDEWRQLPIRDFISFFQHPAKFLLRNRLGIYLRKDDVLTEDREPFELDSLDEYQIGQELLQRYLKEQPLDQYERVMQSRNMLPEGWSGEQGYRKKAADVEAFGNKIRKRLNQQELEDCEVNSEIGDFHLVGTLTNIYPDAQVVYRFGKARPKDLIDWWIRHLLFQQVKPEEHSGRSLFFAWEDDVFQEHSLAPVQDVITPLDNLLDLFWEGLQKPLHLYCKSSYAYAKAISDPENEKEDGIAKAVDEWDASWNGIPGEGDDPYYRLITGGEQPFDDPQFSEYSCNVWDPFFEVLNREDALT